MQARTQHEAEVQKSMQMGAQMQTGLWALQADRVGGEPEARNETIGF